jgi:hypothetical protein
MASANRYIQICSPLFSVSSALVAVAYRLAPATTARTPKVIKNILLFLIGYDIVDSVMNLGDYRQMLDNLRSRYLDILHRRDGLNRELTFVAKSIEGLSALCGEESGIPDPEIPAELTNEVAKSWIKHMGFADACRSMLRIAPSGLTPPEIRDALEMVGFPIELRTNIMVSINVLMTRLVESEEVEAITREDGRKVYRWLWKGELSPTPPLLDRYQEYEKAIRNYGATNSLANMLERQKEANARTEETRRRKVAAGRPGPPKQG